MLVGSSYAELPGTDGEAAALGSAPAPYVVVVVTVETAGEADAGSAAERGLLVGRIVGYSGPRTGIRIEPESTDDVA
jgi:hypothetical protein